MSSPLPTQRSPRKTMLQNLLIMAVKQVQKEDVFIPEKKKNDFQIEIQRLLDLEKVDIE